MRKIIARNPKHVTCINVTMETATHILVVEKGYMKDVLNMAMNKNFLIT